MTNTQIKAFLTLYNSDSAAKAADKLFITQPALSRMIRSLEAELGYSLFFRNKGKHLVPTVEGERFYIIANDIVSLYEQALHRTGNIIQRVFRISATASMFSSFFPAACLQFRHENPHVTLVVDELHSMEAYHQIQLKQLDFSLVNAHFARSDIKSLPICKEKVVLLCSKGLYPPGPLSPAQLDKSMAIITEWNPDFQSWFEYWFGKSFDQAYLRLKTGSYIEQFAGILNFWAIIPYSSALYIQKTSDLEIHDLLDPPPDRICYAIYRRSNDMGLEESFLSCIQQTLEGIDGILPL